MSDEVLKNQTARQVYITMLRQRCQAIDAQSDEERAHWLWAELIKAGHLQGVIRSNQVGAPTGNAISGPTVQGRLFLQELEEKEKAESLRGKFIKFGIPVLTFFGGIIAPVLADWLKKKLGL